MQAELTAGSRILLCLVVALFCLHSGCDRQRDGYSPPVSGSSGSKLDDTHSPPSATNEGQTVPVSLPPVKQVILIYSGDTLSSMQAVPVDATDARPAYQGGGLGALTRAILDYQASITAMNRQRVLSENGDIERVRTDPDRGLLGEHPYLLLDYGGWERGTDQYGAAYVQLQLQMFRDLHYSAVSVPLYAHLKDETWLSYSAKPAVHDLPLVRSSGQERKSALATVPIVTREILGDRWGIVSAPIPPAGTADPPAAWQEAIDKAAQALAQADCRFGILLCKGASKQVYQRLAEDDRFVAVLGAGPPGICAIEGFGELGKGALLLPELQPGAMEIGTCHLIYEENGDRPLRYNFGRHAAVDDGSTLLPYRKQMRAAIETRRSERSAARQGGGS